MEISWTGRVKNGVLLTVQEEREILHAIKQEKSLNGVTIPCIETAF